ncbi:MAG: zinc-ribbon domain-containing protein [Anaerolineae bacterium]|nr:zinc-ribbon domain-containing protein [Anaerolineae bacterium]
MQIVCPHCGEPITAEHINIQRMAAVCPACHTVFAFDPSPPNRKRRKIKQPGTITTDETGDRLHIAFRTNFRLDTHEPFIMAVILSVLLTFITALIVSKALTASIPALLPLGFGLGTLLLYYMTALIAYNKTHIEVSNERITVSRGPLPVPFAQPTTISLAGVEAIRCEETPVSKREGYDTPRYNVWAETVDGSRRFIVSDVLEDYAVFLAQRLNEFLDLETAPDTARLLDDEIEDETEATQDTFTAESDSRRASRT